jgi:hypothetical protein
VYTVISDEEYLHNRRTVLIGYLGALNGEMLHHYSDSKSLSRTEAAIPLRCSAIHLCISGTNEFIFKMAKNLLESVSSHHHSVTRLHQSCK